MTDQDRDFYRPLYASCFFLLLVCLFFSSDLFSMEPISRVSHPGVLDLRTWRFQEHGTVNCSGSWLIYWNRFIPPDRIRFGKTDGEVQFIEVPGSWHTYSDTIKPKGSYGYATVALRVLLPENAKAFLTVEKQAEDLVDTNRALAHEIENRAHLEASLIESHEAFKNSRIALILGMAKLAEYRDTTTGSHLERIREYVKILARDLSQTSAYRDYITPDYIDDIYHSSIESALKPILRS